jgi:hypothetical protein
VAASHPSYPLRTEKSGIHAGFFRWSFAANNVG